jgi:hypothetical protein
MLFFLVKFHQEKQHWTQHFTTWELKQYMCWDQGNVIANMNIAIHLTYKWVFQRAIYVMDDS